MNTIERLRHELEGAGLDAVLLSDVASIQWATGFTGSFGYAIVTPGGGRFLTDSRYTIQAQEQVRSLDNASFGNPKSGSEFLSENLAELGIQKLGFEGGSVTVSTFNDWKTKLPSVEWTSVDFVQRLRVVKSAEEIEKIRRACELADACFDHVQRLIQPGVSEYDIGLEIEFFFRRHGAGLAFDPAVVSGERSAMPHGRPSEKKLAPGEFLTLDFGAKLDGYCSDITRTVMVGEPTAEHRRVYDAVLESQLAALDAMKPGVPGNAVDQVARDVLAKYNLAQYFGHGLGHGLGRLVHDGGSLSPSSKNVLEPGQVWTVEPGAYINGFGGVRIEDDVVVTERGIDILTHSPKELLTFPR